MFSKNLYSRFFWENRKFSGRTENRKNFWALLLDQAQILMTSSFNHSKNWSKKNQFLNGPAISALPFKILARNFETEK